MNKLSTDRINAKSPYKVSVSGDDTFVFDTDFGIKYEIGFIEDYMFGIDGVYQFFISPKVHKDHISDQKVSATVYAVIEEFFNQGNTLLDYVCDTSDGRQRSRNRLFTRWFCNHPSRSSFTLRTLRVVYEDTDYYAAVLIRNDNPYFSEYMEALDLFEDNISDKLR